MNLKEKIRTIPHFPKQGIMFRDITTLIKDKAGFQHAVNLLAERYKSHPVSAVAGIESRGFIFGAALAHRLNVGFIPIRKKGKLPAKTEKQEYDLEYGKDCVEVHVDAVSQGDSILLVDDLIATGGTAHAACKLIEKLGGKIHECAFIIELPDLKGREKLKNYNVHSLVSFEGE